MINTTQQIYAYDDRNKYSSYLKVINIRYQDEDYCLCDAIYVAYDPRLSIDPEHETILINRKNEEVESKEFDSWIASNNQPR